MNDLLYFLLVGIVIELWGVWWLIFHEASFLKLHNELSFQSKVVSGWVCFYCFSCSSTVTETSKDGEIIRQVFIGKKQ